MGKSTLYDLARKGKVPAHKMGRAWRFDAEELDIWVKQGKMDFPDKKRSHAVTLDIATREKAKL